MESNARTYSDLAAVAMLGACLVTPNAARAEPATDAAATEPASAASRSSTTHTAASSRGNNLYVGGAIGLAALEFLREETYTPRRRSYLAAPQLRAGYMLRDNLGIGLLVGGLNRGFYADADDDDFDKASTVQLVHSNVEVTYYARNRPTGTSVVLRGGVGVGLSDSNVETNDIWGPRPMVHVGAGVERHLGAGIAAGVNVELHVTDFMDFINLSVSFTKR